MAESMHSKIFTVLPPHYKTVQFPVFSDVYNPEILAEFRPST